MPSGRSFPWPLGMYLRRTNRARYALRLSRPSRSARLASRFCSYPWKLTRPRHWLRPSVIGNPDGSLDNSYGASGKVIVSFEDGGDYGNALVLDTIGRAVIAGQAGTHFGLVRLQSEPLLEVDGIEPSDNGLLSSWGFGVPAQTNTLQAAPDLTPDSFS